MRKLFSLFAILFVMVGSMKAGVYDQRTIAVPSEFNGWYVYCYATSNNCDRYSNTTIAELLGNMATYYAEDEAVLLSNVWKEEDDYEYIINYYLTDPWPYFTSISLGQVNNGEWLVPFGRFVGYGDMDIDPLYLGGYSFLFMSNELPIAGTQWAILYPADGRDDVDYTDLSTHCYARGVFGGNPVTANKDPQSDYYYTTYYDGQYDFTVATPGAEVYTVSVTGEYATLEPFTEYIIPADLPVLIKSATEDYTIARCEYWHSNTTVPSNLLKNSDAYTQNVSYTLAAEDGILGFYKCERTSIPSDKACLNLPAGASAPRRIAFGTNTTTGMQNTAVDVKAEKILRNGQLLIKKNGHLYNAQGAVVE